MSGADASPATVIRIARRFRGPAESANGGYCAGLIAAQVAAPVVTVRLLRPPPLERDLLLRAGESRGALELVDTSGPGPGSSEQPAGELIALARPANTVLQAPRPVSYPDALAASRHFVGLTHHVFPECFVCGTHRERGDGMRLFAGRLDMMRAAAPWIPDRSLADPTGKVRHEFLWAALDCPGAFAVAEPGQLMVLGEITAQVLRSVHVDESCTVLAWRISVSGRRHEVGTALFDDDDEPCAIAHAWWIEPRRPVAISAAV
ncbi:MAG TPA: hypothetical protein P5528_01240 [Steroidobacteraceae bacterium]|nr:hypothetical protein [Steroidobacteraceae bacterium]HRX88043.1 hypothetical protein [Steroidobacteraceae bacterium]